MLDLKFIVENLDSVKENISSRFMKADADKVVSLYKERNEALTQLEELRRLRNENAQKMKGPMEKEARSALIEEGKALKEKIAKGEESVSALNESLSSEASRIPNMAHPSAPRGKEEKDNLEVARFGEVPSFSFTPKDHLELMEALDLVDFKAGAKVSGAKFYFLKNEAVFVEQALIRFALEKLRKKGFVVTVTPDLARDEICEGTGFNPRGEESNIYALEGTGTCLVGTAEITLGGYYADEIIDVEKPLLMAGLSHCFRREAGAAGQFSKGLYRVHQFTKVEMYVFCKPEESDEVHEFLRETEQEIFNELNIPFRVVDTCTGDLGASAYRKYDLEAWMPGRGDEGGWGEITSTSNCTDYQARRLNVRFKDGKKNRFVHTLNGTAIAMSRAMIALVENFQREDGSIGIPEALQPYTGFSEIRR